MTSSKRNIMRALLTVFLSSVMVSPALAYNGWPAMWLAESIVATHLLFIGLLLEWPFVHRLTECSWNVSLFVTIVLNLVSAIIGAIIISVFGIHLSVADGGVLANWVPLSALALGVDTAIEVYVLLFLYTTNLFRTTTPALSDIIKWIFLANLLSVGVATYLVSLRWEYLDSLLAYWKFAL